MAIPRYKLIDPDQPMHYHLVSRCVRRSFLCGYDRQTRKSYEHRKQWIQKRLLELAPSFAIEVDAFAIMSNHLHLVVYFDPTASDKWSDQEVADRWVNAFPVKTTMGDIDETATEVKRRQVCDNKTLVASRRATLGSISMFMKYLKQPIALRANKEDGCDGHFFEQRFHSSALLDSDALLTAMTYVDLNPVRAKIAKTVADCKNTSVYERYRAAKRSRKRMRAVLRPLASGLRRSDSSHTTTLQAYVELLNRLSIQYHRAERSSAWAARIAILGKSQRAYGSEKALDAWLKKRNFRNLESPLPSL